MADPQQTIIDPVLERMAEVYAQGLIGAAESNGGAEDAVEGLESLVKDVFAANPEFERLLSSHMLNTEEKLGLIDRTLSGQAPRVLLNFLKVLATKGRLPLMRPIAARARAILDEALGLVDVQVTTASELDESGREAVQAKISGLLPGKQVRLHTTVDPEILGGVVVRYGDTMYDGSIAFQLKNIRQQMVNRSIHEIQSGRDRFRHPE